MLKEIGENPLTSVAIEYLENVEAYTNVQKASVHREKFYIYSLAGENKEAYQEISSAIEFLQEPDYYYHRALLSINLKKFEQAIEDCCEIINISHQNNFLYYTNSAYMIAAQAYIMLGNHDQALKFLEFVAEGSNFWTDRLISKDELVKESLQAIKDKR